MLHFMYFTLLMLCLSGHDKAAQDKILFVVSNADHYGDSDISASNHFTELVVPYDELTKAGYEIDFVSPEGGAVPLGYFNSSDPLIKQYMFDCEFMSLLKNTKSPTQINPDDYCAIYFGGGGAAMFGVSNNQAIQDIAMHIYEQKNGIVSAVCHGSYGIGNLKKSNGDYLVAGKVVNGFPDSFERKDADYYKTFEDSVEGLLRKRGGDFQYSEAGWDGFYKIDGRLITGQDPTSARKVAQLIINSLSTIK